MLGDRKQQFVKGIVVSWGHVEMNDRLPASQGFDNQTKPLNGLHHPRRIGRTFALA